MLDFSVLSAGLQDLNVSANVSYKSYLPISFLGNFIY